MNTCPPEEKLSAFLDGELPAPELAELDGHIRVCPACSATLSAFRKLDQVVASATAPAVSPEEWALAWAGIQERTRRRLRPALWRRPGAWLAAAAALLAIVAGSLLLPSQGTGPSVRVATECIAEEIEAGPGYAAAVSYSEDGYASLITITPVLQEEAPRNGASGDVL